jgi:putative transposase
MTHPTRHHPAHPHPVQRFNEPVIVLVTVCAICRDNIFANPSSHSAIVQSWEQSSQWHVGNYVIMPDHVHLFCMPAVYNPEPIKRWAAFWKRSSSVIDKKLRGLWQRDVWDTQIRDHAHYEEKLSYVRLNPVRKKLVGHQDEWPYKGIIHQIKW